MLVLSRKKNEQIVIGPFSEPMLEPIRIAVVEIRGDKVRLGVEAPIEIPVHRKEVFDAIERKAAEAADHERNETSEPQVPEDTKEKTMHHSLDASAMARAVMCSGDQTRTR